MDAIRKGNAARVGLTLRKGGMDLNALHEGELPLAVAARSSAEIVKQLLDAGAKVNARDGGDQTSLMHAADEGMPESVKLLLAAGANPNAIANKSQCPLTKAVAHGSTTHLEVMWLLLDNGADVNADLRTPAGRPARTVLTAAAGSGNTDAMRELIRRGADVRRQNWRGDALFEAAHGGYADAVALLLEAGADPSFRLPADPNPKLAKRAGRSAADLAAEEGHFRIVELINRAAGVKPEPASPPISIRDAWSRLEAALAAKCPDALRSLRAGASPRDISEVERFAREAFPVDLRLSFQLHDGQDEGHEFIEARYGPLGCDPFRLLSLTEVRHTWEEWNTLLKGGEFARNHAQPHPGVREAWFHPGWIPITEDGHGNHHCIDLAPANGGKFGQVILLWHDSSVRPVVADGLPQWLMAAARLLGKRE